MNPIILKEDVIRLPIAEARRVFEREYLKRHLREQGGCVARVAETIGMERTSLHRKLCKLDGD